MNLPLIVILSVLFILGWALVSYFFVRISRQTKIDKQTQTVQPAFRLADQWIMESQLKMEELIESSVNPLATAQHELLDLRLEAGRLPQGVKNLRTVRESLSGSIRPAVLNKPLAEIAALYLKAGDFQVEEPGFIYLETHMGPVPVLETPKVEALSDADMKKWLSRLSAQANAVMGGFLYFSNEKQFKVCEENKDWAEALRGYKMMILDFHGLTALLISLKLYKDTDRLIAVFQEGVQSTLPLVGQADKMGLALTSIGASALSVQTVLDGGMPEVSELKGEGK